MRKVEEGEHYLVSDEDTDDMGNEEEGQGSGEGFVRMRMTEYGWF